MSLECYNVMTESSCFWKCNKNSGCTKFQADYYIQICTHHQELMKSVGSHGGLSLLLMMVVVVWHFMSDSDKFMTVLIVMLHFVEFSPQSHRYVYLLGLWHQKLWRCLSWICHSSSCKWHWAFQFLKIICDPRRIHAIKIWSWHSLVLFKYNFGVCWCLRLWNHHFSTVWIFSKARMFAHQMDWGQCWPKFFLLCWLKSLQISLKPL
jgi:hypothetical protein